MGFDMVSEAAVEFPELLEGKPAVLIFWATWCPYCKAFMPYAKQIQADYAEQGVKIVTFNAKERGRGDPKAYVDSLGFPLVAVADADIIAEDYNIQFIPGLLVVDGQGGVVFRRKSTNLPAGKTVSQQWDAQVREVLDNLIASTTD
jgi:thiol-disulfide isomerase/thioredoxin